jgi:hypothetical protein
LSEIPVVHGTGGPTPIPYQVDAGEFTSEVDPHGFGKTYTDFLGMLLPVNYMRHLLRMTPLKPMILF